MSEEVLGTGEPASAGPAPASSTSGGWRPYQIYALVILTGIATFNYLDRYILSILQEPIKQDLRLSDWQLGLISGPSFALFYSAVGIPVARLAERVNRAKLLAFALGTWSTMSMACGLANNFVQLALGRVGVGMAEGGCSPIAHSMLASYFAPRQRGLAMSVLSASIPLGGFIAPLIGAGVAQQHGWRMAFLAVGAPGVVLAIVAWLTLRDPRPQVKAGSAEAAARPSFLTDIKWLLKTPAFVFLFFASAFMGMALGGTNLFSASYLLREFGLTLKTAGAVMALGLGVAGLTGTAIGGFLADRLAGTRGRSYVLVPALGAGLAGVLFLIAFTRETWPIAAAFLICANVCTDLKNGPNFAAVQNMVPPHMRATGAAVLMMGVTVIGTAMGPIIVGGLSTLISAAAFPEAMGAFSDLCRGGKAAAGAAADVASACVSASAMGVKRGLIVVSGLYLVATCFYFLSSRTIRLRLED